MKRTQLKSSNSKPIKSYNSVEDIWLYLEAVEVIYILKIPVIYCLFPGVTDRVEINKASFEMEEHRIAYQMQCSFFNGLVVVSSDRLN